MKICVLFLTLALGFITQAQKDAVSYKSLKKYSNNKMWLGNSPVSGWVKRGEGGDIISYTQYLDGWKHGKSRHFYATGEKRAIGEYLNNKEHRKWTYWDSNGVKIQEGSYNEGKKIGRWYMLYQQEDLEVICFYSENRLSGNYLKRKIDGKVLEEGNYDKGIPVGEWRYWDNEKKEYVISDKGNMALDPGNVPSEVWRAHLKFMEGKWHYKNVAYTGKIIEHHRNKQLSYEAELQDGCYLWENQYHFDGSIKSEGVYKDCQKDGRWVSYHDNGKLAKEEFYTNGKIDKYYVEYNESGRPIRSAEYKNTKLHGWYKTYQTTQHCHCLKWEAEYKNGQLHGIQNSYDEYGNLIVSKNYENNKLNGWYKTFREQPSKQMMKDGNVVESWTFYDQVDGKIKDHYKAEKGIKNGIYEEFHPNGSLKVKGLYKNGNKEGEWTVFLRNTPQQLKINFKEGQATHTWITDIGDLSNLFLFENDQSLRAQSMDIKRFALNRDTILLKKYLSDSIKFNGKLLPKAEAVKRSYLFHPIRLKQLAFALETGFKKNGTEYVNLNFISPDIDSLFRDYSIGIILPNTKLYELNDTNSVSTTASSNVIYYSYDGTCINDKGSLEGCWYEIWLNAKLYYIRDEDLARINNFIQLRFARVNERWQIIEMNTN
jgi:antitoxin component YwqK of YwqJK toxin-antitoxin module